MPFTIRVSLLKKTVFQSTIDGESIPTVEFITSSPRICGNMTSVDIAVQPIEGVTFEWEPAEYLTINNSDGSIITATPPDGESSFEYTVTPVSALECSASASIEVIVSDSLEITVDAPEVLCMDLSSPFIPVQITAYGADLYSWHPFGPLVPTAPHSNTAVFFPNPANNDTELTVYGESENGECVGEYIFQIQVFQQLEVNVDVPVLCEGESGELSVEIEGGGGDFEYEWTPDIGLSNPNGAFTTVDIEESTAYTLNVRDLVGGCESTIDFVVEVSPQIFAELIAEEGEVFCKGESVELLVLVDNPQLYTYEWYEGEDSITTTTAINSLLVSPSAASNYTVFVYDEFNCEASASIELYLDEPTIIVPNGTVCPGGSITMSAIGLGSEGIYDWQPAEYVECQNSSCSHVTLGPFFEEEDVVFTISGVNDQGCTTETEAKITVAEALNLTLNVENPNVCIGETLQIDVNGALDFTWQGEGLNTTTGNSVTVTLYEAGTYNYTVTGMVNDCETDLTFTITANEVPLIETQDVTICLGESVLLEASGIDGLTHKWFDENGNEITALNISPTQTTTYTVVAKNDSGCQATAMMTIEVNPTPIVELTESYLACINETVSVEAVVIGEDYALLWQPSISVDNPHIANPTILPTETTTYTLTATTEFGCESIAATTINITNSCVFPGDTDNNGEVNMFDLFPIGANFGESDFARNSISNEWQGFGVLDWSESQSNGHNLKYVDCNGNGSIGFEDTTAIVQNFDLFQKSKGFVKGSLGDPELQFIPNFEAIGAGETLEMEVWMGSDENPVTDLYAIAFETTFDINLIEPNSITMDYSGSDLGTHNVDLLAVDLVNEETGRVNVSMSRIGESGINGEVYLLTIQMRTVEIIDNVSDLTFNISDFGATDSNEETILATTDELPTITIDPDIVDIEEFASTVKPYTLFPTFTQEGFQLSYVLQKKHEY